MTTLRKLWAKLWGKIGQPMKPTNHLHDTGVFRAAIYGPALLGLGLAIIGFVNSNLEPNLTFDGFNTFISKFKLPIAVAGLSIPLGALVASHHRSIQSASQIIEQNEQNIFSNYLEHRRYFLAFIEEHEPFEQLNVSAPHLYQRLFPESADGSLKPANEELDELIKLTTKAARKVRLAAEHKLSKDHFKFIDQTEAKAIFEANESLRKFISVPSFKEEEVEQDPFTIVGQTLRQNLDGARALAYCANFHRTYRAEDDLTDLEDNTSTFLEELKPLQRMYNIWRMLSAELSMNTSQVNSNPIAQRLKHIEDNSRANGLSNDDMETIFQYHMNEAEREVIRTHGPTIWKMIIENLRSKDGIPSYQ